MLCYLAQLAKGRADTLLGLLNVSCQLPWVILVKQELAQLWTDRHHLFQSLGHPIDNATVWADFFARFPHQWKRQVRRPWMKVRRKKMQTKDPKRARVQVWDLRRVL